jgi:outer membrane biosynthesis protein TonB
MIDFVSPLSPVDRGTRSRPYLYGSIVLEFDLSAEGRAENVRSVAAEPAGIMESDYVRRIRETHFRPRLVAGEPVAAMNVRFTHYFRVYAARED